MVMVGMGGIDDVLWWWKVRKGLEILDMWRKQLGSEELESEYVGAARERK